VLLLLLRRRLRPCEPWVRLGLLRHSLLWWFLATACMTAPLGVGAFVMLLPSLRLRLLLRPARLRTISCCCCCSSSSSSSSSSSAPPSCPQPFRCVSGYRGACKRKSVPGRPAATRAWRGRCAQAQNQGRARGLDLPWRRYDALLSSVRSVHHPPALDDCPKGGVPPETAGFC
jgi:hypothetical protein